MAELSCFLLDELLLERAFLGNGHLLLRDSILEKHLLI